MPSHACRLGPSAHCIHCLLASSTHRTGVSPLTSLYSPLTTRRLDKWGKPECPKCLSPLKSYVQKEDTRTKAEQASCITHPTSTSTPLPPYPLAMTWQDAMQSESGCCPKGGMHLWRFGKCKKCGRSEGEENRESSPAYQRASRVSVHASPTRLPSGALVVPYGCSHRCHAAY